VCEAEVDVETGAVRLLRYVLVHDSGRILNPMIVEGQVLGAVVHGIGATLYEWMRYDEQGLVSRVSPVQTAVRNCTRDEGGPFEVSNQGLISSHRKLLLSKAMVVSVAETSGQDSDRQGRERRAQANRR
jgi:xanthine dehydrogenase molybdopterin-binding subunit B